nr:hypothetical protein [Deltaproteobacteria bacterium]
MKLAVAALVVAALAIGCGGGRGKPPALSARIEQPETQAEKLLALLPPNAQLVVEVDLARLRANPVVGALLTKLVTGPRSPASAGSLHLGAPLDLPADVSGSPLAVAELVILAAYGVGTANAATISLVASKQPIPDATEIGDGLYALGPTDWIGLVEQRRILALASTPIHAAPELLRLRERAMPERA